MYLLSPNECLKLLTFGRNELLYTEYLLLAFNLLSFFLFECSISQLTNMNEQEEMLLEQFVTLPQLKQVITDRAELVKSIEELASKMSKH